MSLEAIFTFLFLDLGFHTGNVGTELARFTIAKLQAVIWVALQKFDSFSLQGSIEIPESPNEEMWQ